MREPWRVDLPTEGKPIRATRASPRRATSNPSLAVYCLDRLLSGWYNVMRKMCTESQFSMIQHKALRCTNIEFKI